ncbi:hypothetical protein LY78DRAFT_657011 [Colletotrichum sublineola]|nr:hypothetical protein LY78DRAFT_657011 [Colletotrichum sublineola]
MPCESLLSPPPSRTSYPAMRWPSTVRTAPPSLEPCRYMPSRLAASYPPLLY